MSSTFYPTQRPGLRCVLLFLFVLSTLSGCGDSETESTTTDASQASESDSNESESNSTDSDANSPDESDSTNATTPSPGGLELPEGTIPGPNEDTESTDQNSGLELPPDAKIPTNDASTSIEYGSWEEIQETIAESGKITVVDFWSLACEPCLKEFPGLVRLHNEYGESVRCIGVDVDYDGRKSKPPETYEERVVAFLTSTEAEFQNYICSTPSDQVYLAAELPSIPAVMIYDAEGKIIEVFADAGETVGFTYDKDIIPLIARLTNK